LFDGIGPRSVLSTRPGIDIARSDGYRAAQRPAHAAIIGQVASAIDPALKMIGLGLSPRYSATRVLPIDHRNRIRRSVV